MVSKRKQSGFSLVELSIVLVILGLLVGGVLAGQSLIRAAELRAVSTEYSRWVTATQTFRDKYFSLPGDMPNATAFWGSAGGSGTGRDAACVTAMASQTHAGTCNGNGDGLLATAPLSPVRDGALYWDHLAHAGLIEGSFAYTPALATSIIAKIHYPLSKIGSSGWFPCHTDRGNFGRGANNMLILSKPPWSSGACGAGLSTGIDGAEAWSIDTKMDDGEAGLGNMTTTNSYDWSGNVCITSGFTVETLPTAYILNSNTRPACHLYFLLNS